MVAYDSTPSHSDVLALYASQARYASDPAAPAGADWPTRRVPSLYAGKWPPARLLASLIEGGSLARRAAREAEVVISLTDPPLLSLWAGPACRRRGRRWIEWSLDRYPDFFAAAGLVGEGNPLYRLLVRRDAALRPDAVIGLGAGQLHHLAGRRGPLPPAVILPVGLVPPPTEPAPEPDPGSPLTLVYAGPSARPTTPSRWPPWSSAPTPLASASSSPPAAVTPPPISLAPTPIWFRSRPAPCTSRYPRRR
ncbi:MAG: hypothetical protein WCJ64_22100 [Rhodospirillaceae bacterium]